MRTRRPLLLLVGLLTGAALLLPTVPASAGGTLNCTFDPGTKVATFTANNSFMFSIGRDGNFISYNEGQHCTGGLGTATVKNTDLIIVNGDAGSQTMTIDLKNGPFAPGSKGEKGDS